MAVGRYKTHDHKVVVDYGPQTAAMSEEDYRRAAYTPVYADQPFEEDWFKRRPEQKPQPGNPRLDH
jgi:hypothetical protein